MKNLLQQLLLGWGSNLSFVAEAPRAFPQKRFHGKILLFALAWAVGWATTGAGPVIAQTEPVPPPAAAAKPPDTAEASRSVQVLVVYYSLTGHTRKMAEGVAQGVRGVPAAVPVVKPVEEVTPADLQNADAIALGCPAYFANIPGKMKVFLDDWNWKWKVNFTDKVGGAFATGGGQVGGKEHSIISLLLFMINNRMIVAGPLYQDAEGEDIWGEPGAAAMTGPLDPGVSELERDSARRLGDRLARLAKKLQAQPRATPLKR